MRRWPAVPMLSLLLIAGCSSLPSQDSAESAATVVTSPTVEQTLTSRDQLVKDLQVLRTQNWDDQPIFDLNRTNPYADYVSLAQMRSSDSTDGVPDDAKVLGVVVGEQFMQARALLVYTDPRMDESWVGVAIFESVDGQVRQIGTGTVGADAGLSLDRMIFTPTIMGMDIYLKASGDPMPGAWLLHQEMSSHNYSYLPEGMSWIGASLSPQGADLARAEHVMPTAVPSDDIIVVSG